MNIHDKDRLRTILGLIFGIIFAVGLFVAVVISDFYFFERSRKIYYEKGLYALVMDSMGTFVLAMKF